MRCPKCLNYNFRIRTQLIICVRHRYPDGTVYDGEWVAGIRCGKAVVTHANGSIFNGSYDNDVACGEASFLYPGGHTEVKGCWLQGQLHGEVRLLHDSLNAFAASA